VRDGTMTLHDILQEDLTRDSDVVTIDKVLKADQLVLKDPIYSII
jgi:hypothetical protein